MLTDRELRMATALPRVRERFDALLKASPAWRALFAVFETVKPSEDAAPGAIRVHTLASKSLAPKGLPPGSSARQLTAAMVGSVAVTTVQGVPVDEIDTLGLEGSRVELDAWAANAAKAGTAVLFDRASEHFETEEELNVTATGLADAVDMARKALKRLALDLLLAEQAVDALSAEEQEEIEEKLAGGAIVPVVGRPAHDGWVIPHHGSEIVVEEVHAPNVRWDVARKHVHLIAHEEFIVVPRQSLPVCRLFVEGADQP